MWTRLLLAVSAALVGECYYFEASLVQLKTTSRGLIPFDEGVDKVTSNVKFETFGLSKSYCTTCYIRNFRQNGALVRGSCATDHSPVDSTGLKWTTDAFTVTLSMTERTSTRSCSRYTTQPLLGETTCQFVVRDAGSRAGVRRNVTCVSAYVEATISVLYSEDTASGTLDSNSTSSYPLWVGGVGLSDTARCASPPQCIAPADCCEDFICSSGQCAAVTRAPYQHPDTPLIWPYIVAPIAVFIVVFIISAVFCRNTSRHCCVTSDGITVVHREPITTHSEMHTVRPNNNNSDNNANQTHTATKDGWNTTHETQTQQTQETTTEVHVHRNPHGFHGRW
eukprot:TRINITY_DN843_c0_g1_i1.p1 TRINITY_DN843_c0_g1~~TRINITY_DN843_c0_g1_i1.p1  ORF type:complete len:337 (+),score=73.84 TRINITY_DN843_c0_g1_i1:51-1061(+)